MGPYAGLGLPPAIAAYDNAYPLELTSQGSAEAQAAAIADDIAYIAHDIDDGLRAGILTLEGLAEAPLGRAFADRSGPKLSGLERSRMVHELRAPGHHTACGGRHRANRGRDSGC